MFIVAQKKDSHEQENALIIEQEVRAKKGEFLLN
jgi:hypothetical protein